MPSLPPIRAAVVDAKSRLILPNHHPTRKKNIFSPRRVCQVFPGTTKKKTWQFQQLTYEQQSWLDTSGYLTRGSDYTRSRASVSTQGGSSTIHQLHLDRPRSPRRPVLEDGPPDHVLRRQETPDVRVKAVVPVVPKDHHHALRDRLRTPRVLRLLRRGRREETNNEKCNKGARIILLLCCGLFKC